MTNLQNFTGHEWLSLNRRLFLHCQDNGHVKWPTIPNRLYFTCSELSREGFGCSEELCKQNCNNPLHLLYYQTESFNKNRTKLQLVKEYFKLKEASNSNKASGFIPALILSCLFLLHTTVSGSSWQCTAIG